MGQIADVQQAFDQRLNTLAGAPDIAWENTRYNPTVGTTFIRPTLLPAESEHATLAGDQKNTGIYQIDIYVELEKGNSALLTLMDAIYDHFDSVDLTTGTTQIFLAQIARTPAVREESWLRGSIEIFYHSYST